MQSKVHSLLQFLTHFFFDRVALIGGHTIYKIDDTDIIPIANEQARSRMNNPDEARLVRILKAGIIFFSRKCKPFIAR